MATADELWGRIQATEAEARAVLDRYEGVRGPQPVFGGVCGVRGGRARRWPGLGPRGSGAAWAWRVRQPGTVRREGYEAEALDGFRAITDPSLQAGARAEIAGALAQAGQQQTTAIANQAETAARAITDPDEQARAWPRSRKRWPKPAVCTIGTWPTAATPVLLLAPSAFATLTRAMEKQ